VDYHYSAARVRMIDNIFLVISQRLVEITERMCLFKHEDPVQEDPKTHHDIIALEFSLFQKYKMLTDCFNFRTIQDPRLNQIAFNVQQSTDYCGESILLLPGIREKKKKRSFWRRLFRRK